MMDCDCKATIVAAVDDYRTPAKFVRTCDACGFEFAGVTCQHASWQPVKCPQCGEHPYQVNPDVKGSILTDDKHALMSKATFDSLGDYSYSLPSLPLRGKVWRRLLYDDAGKATDKWLMGEFIDAGRDMEGRIMRKVKWREIILV